MSQAILVLNAGSSSLKFSLLPIGADGQVAPAWLHGQIEGVVHEAMPQAAAASRSGHALASPHLRARDAQGTLTWQHDWPPATPLTHEMALAFLLPGLQAHLRGHQLVGVGHRIVHGGDSQAPAVWLDAACMAHLQSLVPLAPLHQPHNLEAVRAIARLAPQLPQVGCPDTAFHATAPALSQRFALPQALHDAGVKRYGFHGLSYEYIASKLAQLEPRAASGRTIVLHLGSGASMCALQGGRSVASSMGFTAVDGLPMATRCGSLDPGVLLWLMDERGLGARQIEHLLYSESGLLGVSGESADMRELLLSPTPAAKLAVDLFVYRIVREMGSLAAALKGLDAVVFTAGIGEHAWQVRQAVAEQSAWLGLALDPARNAAPPPPDQAQAQQGWCISAADSATSIWVLPTDEEGMIARHTWDMLRSRR